MRRYLLPLVVLGAIGAVVVLWVKLNERPARPPREEPPPKEPTRVAETEGPDRKPYEGRTRLDEHRWLRELERVLEREDLSKAYYFRSRVCEDIEEIAEHGTLSKNLLAYIRKYGVESDDLKRRDIVLPILRVFRHPEATEIIRQEYYRAKNENEQIMLLEAMSHSYHDPDTAAVWAVEKALHSDSEEHRSFAFEVIERNSGKPELIVDAATQIYRGSTRPDQRKAMINAFSDFGRTVPAAKRLLRDRLKNPGSEELPYLVGRVESWGEEKDAVYLEGLAMQHPAMAEFLRERAEAIRTARREERGMTDEERRRADEERERQEEERRRREEEEKK